MRPVLPTNHPLNTRSSDRPDSLVRPSSTVPTACFITTEADLDARRDRSRPRFRQQSDRRKCSRNSRRPSTPRQRRSPPRTGRKPAYSASESDDSDDSSVESVVEQEPLNLPSQPSTPSLIGLSHSGSVMSISSQSCSLAGPSIDAHSDLIRDDVSLPVTDLADTQENQSTVPQLIMPSLMVPRRRPFSEVGKSLGKLKIMVAGQCGIGKTSLIKTLAERCEHIVHMDPIENRSAVHATETYASSRPHPWWRSDSELTVTTRRRLSTTGDVLDRNVCFVESPGHRRDASGSWRDLHYVESHLTSLMNKPMADSDLFTLVNSGGEPVVDALLYLIPHSGLVREDVEYIKRAQRMTNVIPVLTRVDELAPEEIKHVKQQVVKSLADKDVDYFSFEGPDDSEETKCVYAVSTESRPDYDTMDASTLMDSEYIPPLLPTDMGRLVDHIFSLDGSARLRHSAAVKCIKWRRDHGDNLLQNALSSGALVSRYIPEGAMRLRSFRRTPSWDRLELYNWANNLRQSLQSERLYHLMEERAISNAVAKQSSLVHVPRSGKKKTQSKKRKAPQPTHQDPLGLLEMGGGLKQKGMFALEMVSSVGLVGLVASKIMHTGWSDGMCSVVASRRRNIEVGRLSMVLSF
ncbi:Septin-domain-containing protein [Fusarium sp. MPI-SDFR-AT-0072]|nr:Septin-domain-containing protein [Fusarium sp. MPI-SDFR-AT-0072]